MNKSILLMTAAAAMSPLAYALTQQEIDAAAEAAQRITNQEEQRKRAEQDALQPPKQPRGVDLNTSPAALGRLKNADGSCIELKRIQITGGQLLDEWDLEVLEAPFLGKCVNAALAQEVLGASTNFYLSRGFITSKAYLPKQNLKDGVLDVFMADGQVANVTTQAAKPITLGNVYEKDEDLGLNIRDLEQAVDQMNAVPGNDVVMAVKPGAKPQTSEVVFQNKGKPGIKGRIAVDNTGTEATGVEGLSVALQAGDLFRSNEVWSIHARKSLSPADKNSHSFSADLRIPHGYNTYGIGHTKGGFNTMLQFPLTGTQLTNEGANESSYLSAERVVHRDQNSKHTLAVKLKRDSTESYIAGTKIDVSSRTLDALAVSSESVIGIGRNVLIISPEISAGLSEVDNLPAGVNTPVENPQAEYLRYRLSVDWSQPFSLGRQSLRFKSKWVGQYADAPLYGSQQLIVGGAASVRGSHSVSIVGDKGYYWQNTLSLVKTHQIGRAAINAEYSLGYDFGRVSSVRPLVYEGGMKAFFFGLNLSTASGWGLSVTHAVPMDVDGGLNKGDAHTSATISLDF